MGGRGSSLKLSVVNQNITVGANKISDSTLAKLMDNVNKNFGEDVVSEFTFANYGENRTFLPSNSSIGIIDNNFENMSEFDTSFKNMNIKVQYEGNAKDLKYRNDPVTVKAIIESAKAIVDGKDLFENDWGIPFPLTKIVYTSEDSGSGAWVSMIRAETPDQNKNTVRSEPILYINLESFTDPKKVSEWKQSYDEGTVAGIGPKNVVYHELGHIYEYHHAVNNHDNEVSLISNVTYNLTSGGKEDYRESVVYPTKYGFYNPSEGFAEAFSLIMQGKTRAENFTEYDGESTHRGTIITYDKRDIINDMTTTHDSIDGGKRYIRSHVKPLMSEAGLEIPEGGVIPILRSAPNYRKGGV